MQVSEEDIQKLLNYNDRSKDMNKKRVDEYIPRAIAALMNNELANDNKIDKRLRNQIASFGSSVIMGSLYSAVIFFSDYSGDLSKVKGIRCALMNCIYDICSFEENTSYKSNKLLKYLLDYDIQIKEAEKRKEEAEKRIKEKEKRIKEKEKRKEEAENKEEITKLNKGITKLKEEITNLEEKIGALEKKIGELEPKRKSRFTTFKEDREKILDAGIALKLALNYFEKVEVEKSKSKGKEVNNG